MADPIGKNTLASAEIRSFVDRLENIDVQKKALGEDRKLILQEARAKGYATAGIEYVVKVRRMKPHQRQEAESIRDLYMHAAGMDSEPPLFRALKAFADDALANDALVEAFKKLVPAEGEIIVNVGGRRLRLWRDKAGDVHEEDFVPPSPSSARQVPKPPPKRDVPNCTPDEAFDLGAAAAKANEPVISNPFPYGDERRARWDEGWRHGSGNDGMG